MKRYKRFLADVVLDDGREITAHCPNPGRMSSILPAPKAVYLTELPPDPRGTRKLDFRWELAEMESGFVVVNTQLANRVALRLLNEHAATKERLRLTPDCQVQSEVTVKTAVGKNTRFDFFINHGNGKACYLEVKQVSLRAADQDSTRWAAFPDAVTARGKRHLEHLISLHQAGHRCVLFYVVGRGDVDKVRPAVEIDPEYGATFQRALREGVEVVACRLAVTPEGLSFDRFIPVDSFT